MRRIKAVLYLFLNRYSLGLYPFINRIPPFHETPEIAEMLRIECRGGDPGCHIDGGEKIADAQRIAECTDHIRDIIRRNGWLDVYCDTFEWYERECPERVGTLSDLPMLKSPEFMTKIHVASAHNMNVRTMDRKVDKAM